MTRPFHEATIGGLGFEGIVAVDGPTLLCRQGGWSPLGIACLREFRPSDPDAAARGERGWAVVKYRPEVRIRLTGFGQREVDQLRAEFGLTVLGDGREPSPDERWMRVAASPAWLGLRRWVAAHPRLAARFATGDAYLPGWYARARAAEAGEDPA